MSQLVRQVLDGERILLRTLQVADVTDTYCQWMNDPETNRYLESRFTRHSIGTLKAYVAEKCEDKAYAFFAIVLKNTSRHIGNIKLGPIDPHHHCGDIGIVIGEKDCWGQGYATEAINLLVRYAFDNLKLHKITAGCYATNQGSVNAFKKAGFVVEGIRRSHCYCDGKYVDDILMGIINPQ